MKQKLQKILQTLLSMCLGAGMALCVMPRLFSIPDMSLWQFEAAFFLNFLLVLLVFLLTTALHEAGHLIAGLLSGYRFVSYRVLSLTVIRLNGKLRVKRYSLAGTAGQCLMKPPAWTAAGIPVCFYNLGGLLMNALCLAVSLPLCFVIPAVTFGGMLLLAFAVTNGITLLINGIPMANNDAHNVLHLTDDPNAVRAFWAQMMGNALLAEGVALAEFPDELYDMPGDADRSNPLIASCAALKAQLPLFRRHFEEGDAAIAGALEKFGEAMPAVIRTLMIGERVWFELMTENRRDVLTELKTREYLQYCKAMRRSLSVNRVLYTEALANGNDNAADTLRRNFERLGRHYPYPQELEEERYLMQLAAARFHRS